MEPSNQTPKRYIVDGPRMSGKSTLLFGYSHRNESPQSLSSLESIATCMPEATEEAHRRLHDRGESKKENIAGFGKELMEISAKYLSDANDPNKIYFFDRSIYSAEKFCKEHNVDISDKIKQVLSQKNFEQTVFLLEPFKSINGEGRESYNNRLNKLNELKSSYKQEGYNVVIVPVFSEQNREENNAKRISFIQEKLVELEKTN